jgi:hypothetical protein
MGTSADIETLVNRALIVAEGRPAVAAAPISTASPRPLMSARPANVHASSAPVGETYPLTVGPRRTSFSQ